MTAALPGIDVSELNLDIACEWAEYDCPHPATVMSKACGDDRHYAICAAHLGHLQRWFEAHKFYRCVCNRPFIEFALHYDIIEV